MPSARVQRSSRSAGHPFVVAALLLLGSVLSVATVVAVWARTMLLDTDRYVETVAPLAADADVLDTATHRIVDALMGAVDVEALAAEALPPSAASLAPAIAAGTRTVVEDATSAFFASSAFRELWDDANRVAHREVVQLLTGRGDVVRMDDGVVVIDLAAIAEQVRVRLVDDGLTLLDNVPISEVRAQLEVMRADELVGVQRGIELLQQLAWWLPLGVLVSFGTAVVLSSDRRVGIRRVGVALTGAMVVLAIAFGIGRRFYLGATDTLLDPATAEATFDILTRFVRQGVRFVMAVGLLIVAGAWLSGPSDAAQRIRNRAAALTDRTGRRLDADGRPPGAVVSWIASHHRGLRAGLLVVIGVLLVTLDHPSVTALVVALGVAAIGWLGIEAIASSTSATTGAVAVGGRLDTDA